MKRKLSIQYLTNHYETINPYFTNNTIRCVGYKDMNKLEQLKKEIQRLRPEIKIKLKNCPDCGEEIGYDMSNKLYFCGHCSNGFNGLDIDYLVRNNIRPITLEDVLAVLRKKKRRIMITDGGNFNELNFDEWDWTLSKWTFGKPLDDQSKETINFLYSLIVK